MQVERERETRSMRVMSMRLTFTTLLKDRAPSPPLLSEARGLTMEWNEENLVVTTVWASKEEATSRALCWMRMVFQ